MRASVILAIVALIILLFPRLRKNEGMLVIGCLAVYFSLWIDKGLGMVIAGFVPSPMHTVVKYWPTLPEFLISAGVYAIGALIVTLFYKIVLSSRGETIPKSAVN